MTSSTNLIISETAKASKAAKATTVKVKRTPRAKNRMTISFILSFSQGRRSIRKRTMPLFTNDKQFLHFVFSILPIQDVEALTSISIMFASETKMLPEFLTSRQSRYCFPPKADVSSDDARAMGKIKSDWVALKTKDDWIDDMSKMSLW